MIGKVFNYLARGFLTDHEIISRAALHAAPRHVSKHRQYDRDGKSIPGKQIVTEYSSIKKRMRAVNGFKVVQISPARRRQHWHAHMRQMWADISLLGDKLEKDRERRRMLRLAA